MNDAAAAVTSGERYVLAAPPDTLDIEEAAAVMKIGVDSMRELVVAGAIPALSHNPKHCVILRGDLLAYISTMARRQQAEKKGRVAVLPRVDSAPTPAPRRRTGRARRPLPNV